MPSNCGSLRLELAVHTNLGSKSVLGARPTTAARSERAISGGHEHSASNSASERNRAVTPSPSRRHCSTGTGSTASARSAPDGRP